MIISDEIKVTTEILQKGALLFALADIVYILILSKFIKSGDLIKMKWYLVSVMGIFFFFLFGIVVSIIFWGSVYSYVFPAWARWIIPPLYGLLFSMAGLLFWWISSKFTKGRLIIFCLLGGFWCIITHIMAIYRGILEKPPMLKGAGPGSALTIAAFEFIFYWCICLTISKAILYFKSIRKTDGILI